MLGHIKRDDRLMLKQVGDEALLLDIEHNLLHRLNATAGFIWSHCDTLTSPEALAHGLAGQYDVDEQIALRDVMHTLDRMRALHLLSSDSTQS